jgi:hypothetical protein
MSFEPEQTEPPVLRIIRRLLLLLLIGGLIGTATDLILIAHYETGWQLAPLVMIALAIAVAAWIGITGGSAALAALRIVMVVLLGTGAIGIVLHGAGNREFQREIDPTLEGWPLMVKVLTAKAPPALAPASMIQLGLLGLLYGYRHPAARMASAEDSTARTGA